VPISHGLEFNLSFIKIKENNDFKKNLAIRKIKTDTYPDWIDISYDKVFGIVKIEGTPPSGSKLDFNLQFYIYDHLSWDNSTSYLIFFRDNDNNLGMNLDYTVYLVSIILFILMLIIIILCLL